MSTNEFDQEDPFEKLARRQEQDGARASEQEEIAKRRREAEDAERERELDDSRRAADAQQMRVEEEPLKTSKTPRDAYKNLKNLIIPILAIALFIWWIWAPAPGSKVKDKSKDEVNALQQKTNVSALIDQMTRDARPKPKPEAPPEHPVAQPTHVTAAPPAASDADRQAAAKAIEEARKRDEEINAAPLETPGGQVRTVDGNTPASSQEVSVSARQSALRSQLQAMASAQAAADPSARGPEMPARAPGYAAAGYGNNAYAAGGAMGGGGYGAMPAGYGGHGGMPPGGTPQGYDQEFMDQQRAASGEPLQVLRQQSPTATYVIDQGTPIQAVLLTGINSDLPGDITAMVSYDVYDSRGNGAVLIPKGSRFVGKYNSQIIPGQERVLVAVNRLIRPDGTWISLAGANGTDPMGQSGLEADVNNHFFKIFGTSLIIGAASYLLPSSDRTITSTVGGLGGIQNGGTIAGQALNETVKAVMARNKEIAPTLSRKPGTEFYFMAARDMVLQPYHR
ncbi:TrbI/VirB10 family protein [Noviherbaspirillum pedocola]|uniref:TrbI/VirB10 family protein n=1 Tax=Noviherbaspirillum pedocola TaxID=2801341 RepID=A0A934ST25_9BURK|nr:TrbI/VirB10 family protein [Noviherbaspirillum pedocola]MBK4736080.1 TrbI/VirB10 family protein [Noviherbaspirillum pedocola]